MAANDEVLTIREAASYLRINQQTARRLARSNQIPAFKVGGAWRFKRRLLDQWADSQSTIREPGSILVIDDEQHVLDSVERLLSSEGFSIATASSGPEALERLRREVPDLVLLDLKMPGMDGPTILREIRRGWGFVPVVVLTGYPDSELMSSALEYSPITLLAKPVAPERLLEAVGNAVKGSAEQRRSAPISESPSVERNNCLQISEKKR